MSLGRSRAPGPGTQAPLALEGFDLGSRALGARASGVADADGTVACADGAVAAFSIAVVALPVAVVVIVVAVVALAGASGSGVRRFDVEPAPSDRRP